MELEKNTFNKLIEYLKDHGYPEESFAIEYKIGKYRADLVIIDPKLKIPIILFEVKSVKNQRTMDFGKSQIKKYLTELKDMTIPSYLVFPAEYSPFFQMERIFIGEKNEVNQEPLHDEEFLNYIYQRNARISEKYEKKKTEKKRAIDIFKIVCWCLAAIIITIGILNKISKINVNAIDLSLLGVAIGLFIIPYANKIKILGMEFERLEKEK